MVEVNFGVVFRSVKIGHETGEDKTRALWRLKAGQKGARPQERPSRKTSTNFLPHRTKRRNPSKKRRPVERKKRGKNHHKRRSEKKKLTLLALALGWEGIPQLTKLFFLLLLLCSQPEDGERNEKRKAIEQRDKAEPAQKKSKPSTTGRKGKKTRGKGKQKEGREGRETSRN